MVHNPVHLTAAQNPGVEAGNYGARYEDPGGPAQAGPSSVEDKRAVVVMTRVGVVLVAAVLVGVLIDAALRRRAHG